MLFIATCLKITFLNSATSPREYHSSYHCHYNDVMMSAMASQITDVSNVYSTVCSDADQRKHQSSASLAFVRGIHRWPMNYPHKGDSNAENVSIWLRHHCCHHTITESMDTLTTDSYYWCTLLEKMWPSAIMTTPFGLVVEAMFMMFSQTIDLGWNFH